MGPEGRCGERQVWADCRRTAVRAAVRVPELARESARESAPRPRAWGPARAWLRGRAPGCGAGHWRRNPPPRPQSRTAPHGPASGARSAAGRVRQTAAGPAGVGATHLVLQVIKGVLHPRDRAPGVYQHVEQHLCKAAAPSDAQLGEPDRAEPVPRGRARTDCALVESRPTSWYRPGCTCTSCRTHQPAPTRRHAPPASACSAQRPW